jgi:FixJ family two-component response regulator
VILPHPVVAVVDDDASVRRALARVLRLSGYDVQIYASGQAFLLAFDAARVACVLLDIRMDGLSGFDVLERIRGDGVPVILITGHGDPELRHRAIEAGAVSLLDKPLDSEVLIAELERVAVMT